MRRVGSDGWAGTGAGTAAAAVLALLLIAVPPLRASFALFSGGHGSRLLVMGLELGFVALVLLGGAARWPAWPKPRSVPGAALAVWLAASTLAVLASDHFAPALVRQAEWWTHGVFAVALWVFLRERPGRLALLAAGVAVGGLFWVVMLLSLEGLETRSIPGFGNIRHFGYWAAVCTAFAAGGLVSRRLDLRGGVALAAMTLASTFLFWSGTRAGLVATGVGLLAASRLRLGGVGPREWVAWAAALGMGFALASQLPAGSLHMGVANMARRTAIEADRGVERLGSRRALVWRRGGSALLQSPLLGKGPDGYAFEALSIRGRQSQPHGFPLQFALEWGLPGAAAFAVLIAFLGVAAVGRVRARALPGRVQCGGVIAFLTLATYATATGAWYHAFPTMWTAVALAVALQPGPGAAPAQASRRVWAAAACLPAFVFALHLGVVAQLARTTVPEPDSAGARWVRAFPSRVGPVAQGLGVAGWIRAWNPTRPETTVDWLHWLHAHSLRPSPVLLLEARLLQAQGQADEARAHLERALDYERDVEVREAIEAQLRE